MKKHTSTKKDEINIFFILKCLSETKIKWEDLQPEAKKIYNQFMINRSLSMNTQLIEIVNEVQKMYFPNNELHYKFWLDFLPKGKLYLNWIKKSKENKYNEELIRMIANHYHIALKCAKEYIDIYKSNKLLSDDLELLIRGYGKDDNDIKKIL